MVDYNKFEVIIDTREQQPWQFDNCAIANHKLDTGDYSVNGLQDILCIERKKSVSEFATNITESRFINLLERMQQYKYSFFIMEFDFDDIYKYPVGSNIPKYMWDKIKISSGFIIKNLLEIQLKYNIHVLFCGDVDNATKIAITLMRKVYELEYKNK